MQPTRTAITAKGSTRAWIWAQLLVAWLPVFVLATLAIVSAHGGPVGDAALVALRMVACAALLSVLVRRFIARHPWPRPMSFRFVLLHVLAAALFSLSWFALNSLIESALQGALAIVIGPGLGRYLTTGVWLYVMVAGVSYAHQEAARAGELAALAARTQLEALRAQLHPHFLFNALHTVVQLIPLDPREAARAAEELAALLRAATEERRDLIPLREEWALARRYLALESLRLGERLKLDVAIEPEAEDWQVPSFALQTLVENAVRHGVAPRVGPTRVTIEVRRAGDELRVVVSDDGAGADPATLSGGTGLARLGERLRWLYRGRPASSSKASRAPDSPRL
jgi:signal transduction histidine kinase